MKGAGQSPGPPITARPWGLCPPVPMGGPDPTEHQLPLSWGTGLRRGAKGEQLRGYAAGRCAYHLCSPELACFLFFGFFFVFNPLQNKEKRAAAPGRASRSSLRPPGEALGLRSRAGFQLCR